VTVAVRAVAVDLDGALGDTRQLWQAWLVDASRRLRVELEVPDDRGQAAVVLDAAIGNWRPLLERFAEEHAPIYLRPRAEASTTLRRLQGDGVRIGAFTDAPEELANVALAQLGAARRLEAVEAGSGALERLLDRLGPDARIVRSTAELGRLAT
jgi:phosphoglycolate phosphatase-like HAD superfamily hydrolase